ncbi:MAG TPA: cytochrome c oxidase assembly factor Coa1 family protein [Pirellulaceae bacterium]|nr:cytochrome c oxidase assembly factor Coa1 family protein [Pirellulaceae bacterium]
MSQFPNQPGYGPNPFGQQPGPYQPPKSSKAWLWILLGVGGVGLLVCCGCGGLFLVGMGVVGNQLVAQLNADPNVQQHLGTVTSANVDWMATGEEGNKAPGKSVMVFNVVGEKGSAKVIVEQTPGQQHFNNGRLRLPSGEEIPLSF